jgi:outer membrane lipoprotein LolB
MRVVPERRRALGLAALALLLSACASLAPRKLALSEGDIRLSGRLVVQVAGDSAGTAQGGNALFELSGKPEAGQLELSTPLGSLVARAYWQDGDVRLQTPREERRFEDMDALTRELLGEAIPVSALFYWLRGEPWPERPSQRLSSGQEGFEQFGWVVDTSRFADGIILANRAAAPSISLRARIER